MTELRQQSIACARRSWPFMKIEQDVMGSERALFGAHHTSIEHINRLGAADEPTAIQFHCRQCVAESFKENRAAWRRVGLAVVDKLTICHFQMADAFRSNAKNRSVGTVRLDLKAQIHQFDAGKRPTANRQQRQWNFGTG